MTDSNAAARVMSRKGVIEATLGDIDRLTVRA
jgi:hypothetical protein